MRLKTAIATTATVLGVAATISTPGTASAGTEFDITDHCLHYSIFTTGTGYHVHLPSTTPFGGEQNCILAQGDQGAGVFVLQDALRRCYAQAIAWDAIYGPATAEAVRNVQRWHGITVDGIYGPQTRAAMAWPKYRDSDNQYDHCWR